MGIQNFTQWTNADWCASITARDCNGDELDLTGADAFMNVETRTGIAALRLSLGDGLTIADATAGKINIAIPQAKMATLAQGIYLYDLIVNVGGVKTTVSHGSVHVRQGITEWTLLAGAAFSGIGNVTAEVDRINMGINFQVPHATQNSVAVAFPSLLSCARATSGWAKRTDGTLAQFAPNQLRITDQGLLIEEARTNLELNSVDLSGGYKNNVIITANDAIAPDGSNAANKFLFAAVGQHNGSSVSLSASTSYVYSLFVKDDGNGGIVRLSLSGGANWSGGVTPNFDYDLATDTLTNHTNVDASGVEIFANGWKRIWFSCTTDTSVAGSAWVVMYSLAAVTYHAWGLMVEEGSFPTSYIETTGAAATRAADDVAFSDLSWLNETIGTLLLEYLPISDDSASYPIFTLNKDNTSKILLKMDKRTNGKFGTFIYNGGTQYYKEDGLFVEGQSVKIACAFWQDDVNSAVDGAVGTADTSATLPTGINNLRFGQNEYGIGSGAGWMRSLTFWPERKSDAELAGLTT